MSAQHISAVQYLVEADISAVLTEALTAQVEPVLADERGGLAADTATQWSMWSIFTSCKAWAVPFTGILAEGVGARAPDVGVDHLSNEGFFPGGSPPVLY